MDALVRRVTFDVLGDYFGVPDPPNGDLRVWATRLFEFQFADMGNDAALRVDVDEIAPALRAAYSTQIEQRRASRLAKDDVLGRCLELQATGEPGFSDDRDPHGPDGLRRWRAAAAADGRAAGARAVAPSPAGVGRGAGSCADGDDELLAGYVFEAMRFDPLAPALPRIALKDCTIAAGTGRARKVPKGATVLAAFSSAMMDERRVAQPRSFNPRRLPHEYIHFGYGLHTCFGIHMNKVLLPLMLKSLLKRPRLRRAPGPAGRLRKRGAFADQLHVVYD